MKGSFYGNSIILLEGAISNINAKLDTIRKYKIINNEDDPIEYITTRIKSEDSMKEKLKRKKLKVNRFVDASLGLTNPQHSTI